MAEIRLGYTGLTAYGVLMWMTHTGLFHFFGASSLIYGLGLSAYSDSGIIVILSFCSFLLILAGLVIVPVLTAFRLRVPLYVLMGLDVLGRVLLIASKALEHDLYALAPVILGLLVSMVVLVVTIHLFCKPEPDKEAIPYANA